MVTFNFLDERLPQRFWDKVSPCPMSGCWLWTGAISTFGYAWFALTGNPRGGHRIAYLAANGSIPDGLQLDHLCRIRSCVNPAHLEAVTQKVNVLRGVGPCAINARVTHCPRGHAYDEKNTRIQMNRQGGRVYACRHCRTCSNATRKRSSRRAATGATP